MVTLFHQHLTFLFVHLDVKSKKLMFHVQSSPHSPSLTGEILNWPFWCDQLLIANWLRCWVDTNRESSDNFSKIFSCHPSHYLKSFSHHNKQPSEDGREKFAKKQHTFCVPTERRAKKLMLDSSFQLRSASSRHLRARWSVERDEWNKIEKKEFASLTLVAFIRR